MRALLIAAALLLAGFSAQAETVRIGYQKTGTLVVVKQRQLLEQALAPTDDVKWVEFQSGPPLMEALNAGAIDLGYAGDSPPVFAQAGGVDLLYVAGQPIAGRNAGLIVHKDAPIRSVADLRGKRIAVTKGSSAHYGLVAILKTAGLRPSDVKVVYLQPADGRAAFRAGSVDAWSIWDPFFAAGERDADARTLTDASVAPSNTFLLTPRAFAKTHGALLLKILGVIDEGAAWAESNGDDVAKVMAQATGVDLDVQRIATARGSFRYLLMNEAIIRRQQAVADTFSDLHLIPGPVDVRSIVWTPPADVPVPATVFKEPKP